MDSRKLLADVRLSGLTQSEIAHALGITQGAVSKLESGRVAEVRAPTFRRLDALHRRLVKAGKVTPSIIRTAAKQEA